MTIATEDENRETIQREITERLQWAAVQLDGSDVTGEQLMRLNGPFGVALKRLVDGQPTEAALRRVRNLLGVYKDTILELVK
jgi:hypothetical protein